MALAVVPPSSEPTEMGSVPEDKIEGDIQALIVACNKDGMSCLRDGQLKAAFEQFKYAEAILLANSLEGEDCMPLLATTCNNLGCYYKKVGKYHGALSYLRRALKMEVELKTDEVTLAGTHLNLCSVLSKLEKHDKAVQHALMALDLMNRKINGNETENSSEEDYTVLAIGYHNVGLEREFLEQFDQAATFFRNGFEVAKRFLGESHALTITMGNNCDAVLRRARQKKVRPGVSARRSQMEDRASASSSADGTNASNSLSLPPIKGAMKGLTKNAGRNEAQEWIKSEEALWATFAQKTLQPSSGVPAMIEDIQEEEPPLKPQPLTAAALVEMQDLGLIMPKAFDMGTFRFQEKATQKKVTATSLEKALDSHPQALMDIIDADGDGEPSGSAALDFRPNRAMKRSTRTARVVRRTGVFNTTFNRDKVTNEKGRLTEGSSAITRAPALQVQQLAATKIQQTFRRWRHYCEDNSEWMTVTWICATMIQTHWRSYHVRRLKLDMMATRIQKRMRGILVRRTLKWHNAAVTIQKRMIGILTRIKLQRLHKAATHMQRLVRGGLARRRYKRLQASKVAVIVTIQRHVRRWLAKQRVGRLRAAKYEEDTFNKATTDLQRMFRGWKGRNKAYDRFCQVKEARIQYEAACRLQSQYRARKARRRVDDLRLQRLQEMEKAATFLRKVFLGQQTKKKYKALREDFKRAEGTIIVIQRYMRGCLCRNRLWKEAVLNEEQNWAAIEIQRHWRGYLGRVKWEDKLETVWRREMAAAMLQRNLRGWLARLKVNRKKRKIARAAFERARLRFCAAQQIQARARGMIVRKVQLARFARAKKAATAIQRIHRGGMVRTRMWRQVRDQRVVIIQAAARGYIIRKKYQQLYHKACQIQRVYREWLQLPIIRRLHHRNKKQMRMEKAAKIQRKWRSYMENKKAKLIHQGWHQALPPPTTTAEAVPAAAATGA
eukprot:TRINITY_DN40814_c0_g1_i1.p1 TRINITY_DN40814_c0_g1~~TRINITY_DN40814_c0_g1_i1.p1  ORF type:complete len:986 (+),score=184.92 TRINITY_DN40814_c0_g1_i1:106-2958(+)